MYYVTIGIAHVTCDEQRKQLLASLEGKVEEATALLWFSIYV